MTIKIGVHNGKFHADDVMCIALIKYFVSQDIEVIRSRDEKLLADCNYVLDVGNREEISEDIVWLDHHQEPTKHYDNGLAYAACGKLADYLLKDNPKLLTEMRNKLLWPIEALDNGQDAEALELKENLFSFVTILNCTWKEDLYGKEQDEHFMLAVEMTYNILDAFMKKYNSYEEADRLVTEAIEKSSDGILILDQYIGGWGKLVCIHNTAHSDNIFKLGIIKSKEDLYLLQSVAISEDSNENYFTFPWGGLTGDDFDNATGVSGGVFCHKAGFLCGFKTLEAAMTVAKKLLLN